MRPKKRILVVTQHFWPESFRINDICDFLVEKDYDIDVLCGTPNYPMGNFYKGYNHFNKRREFHKGVNIYRVFEIPRKNNTNFRVFLNYISFPIASLFHIPRLLSKKYDKIFLFQTSPVLMSMVGIIVGKLRKTEITMNVLDLWPENLFSVLKIRVTMVRKLATKVSIWHYNHVDKMIVLSESMRNRLLKVTNIDRNKIIVIPQVSEKIYETDVIDNALVKRFGKGFNVLFTGNISPAQSFETIISAAKKINKAGINNINWIIVGDGMSRQDVEKQVKEAGLSTHFYFEGVKPITDIPKYNHVADLLIGCLVRSDLLEATIPAKVMSYIASGRPIVLAMDGEVQDLINNKIGCGFAGPTEDSEILYKNIKKVYDMPSKEREKLGKLARNYHFKHFERDANLEKLRNFIFD